jgi:mono/diheme cytochrome c family protein
MRKTTIATFSVLICTLAATFTRTHLDAQTPEQHGKAVYDAHCVECHGESGRGDGSAAAHLNPRPRDFTGAKYKIRSTETGTVPTDDDLIRSVRQGLYGTSMPSWDRVLSDTEIRDVVVYVKTMSPQFTATAPKEINTAPPTPSSSDSIARGKNVFVKLQCGKCHGDDGRGAGAVATVFEDETKTKIAAADLTEPWQFRGGATSRDVFMRFRAGMTGTPMPSFAEAASDGDLWDLSNYVLSLGRKPVWSMNAQEVTDLYARLDAEAKQNPVKRGEFLVESLGCPACHSPADDQRRMLPGMRLAGGLRFRAEPFGEFVTMNLTSDKATGLGNWSDDEIKRAITKGITRTGTRLLPFPMDYGSYSTMKADDLNAIVSYLRTVPPVSNLTPPPKWTFFPMYMWGKFRMLILGEDLPLTFYPGNAGTPGGAR